MTRHSASMCAWLAASLLVPAPASAQFDRSCNALQLTKLGHQLNRLSAAEQSRLAPKADALRRNMEALFDGSRKTEYAFSKLQQTHLEALLRDRQSMIEKLAKSVLKEKPGLDQEALQAEVFARLYEDPDFGDELRKRMMSDPAHEAIAERAFREQSGAYHDLERKMYEQVLNVPPPEQEYTPQMEAAYLRYMRERGGPTVVTVTGNTRAMQELSATLDAVRQGTSASLSQRRLEPLVSASRLVWDTPADAVVSATEELRGTVRAVESMRLRSQLDFGHLPNALAPAGNRAEQIRKGNGLSRAVAKTAGRAIQDRVVVREAYTRLDRISVPAPPPSSDPAASRDWKARAAAQVKAAADKVKRYVLE